jgi:general secretion pathway protein A
VLRGFDLANTIAYIDSRMAHAGLENQTVFSGPLMEEIQLRSQGIPRLINAICDNLLLTCFATETKVASIEMLDEISADLHLEYPAKRPLESSLTCSADVSHGSRVPSRVD